MDEWDGWMKKTEVRSQWWKKMNVQVSEDSDIEHRTSNEKQTSTLGTFPVYPSEVLVEKEK